MMREMVSEDVAAAVTRDIEGEAHSFAANLLMPKRRVLGMVPTHADCLNGNIGRFAQN